MVGLPGEDLGSPLLASRCRIVEKRCAVWVWRTAAEDISEQWWGYRKIAKSPDRATARALWDAGYELTVYLC